MLENTRGLNRYLLEANYSNGTRECTSFQVPRHVRSYYFEKELEETVSLSLATLNQCNQESDWSKSLHLDDQDIVSTRKYKCICTNRGTSGGS